MSVRDMTDVEIRQMARRTADGPRFNETTTKREMFAAMAMAAIVEAGRVVESDSVAEWAVEYADALIAELAKGE